MIAMVTAPEEEPLDVAGAAATVSACWAGTLGLSVSWALDAATVCEGCDADAGGVFELFAGAAFFPGALLALSLQPSNSLTSSCPL